MTTAQAETLGDGSDEFAEQLFSIDKVTVTAKSRALKAEYTMELAQDLKAIQRFRRRRNRIGPTSYQVKILSEINREVVRTINSHANEYQVNTTTEHL